VVDRQLDCYQRDPRLRSEAMAQRPDVQRSTDEKIARLRARVKTLRDVARDKTSLALLAILLGILDLLGDEL